jgi:hypothetical protein
MDKGDLVELENAEKCRQIKEKFANCKLLLLDEISMCSCEQLGRIDRILATVRER